VRTTGALVRLSLKTPAWSRRTEKPSKVKHVATFYLSTLFIPALRSRDEQRDWEERYPRAKLIWTFVSLNLPIALPLSPSAPPPRASRDRTGETFLRSVSLALARRKQRGIRNRTSVARGSPFRHGVLGRLFSAAASCEAKLPLIVRGSGNRPRARAFSPMRRARKEQTRSRGIF